MAPQSGQIQPIQTPVVGNSLSSNTPTSSDVHLYEDPWTKDLERPFFHADCEGIDGGNVTPVAGSVVARGMKKLEKFGKIRRRRLRRLPLSWPDGKQKNRQWMVKEFYLRILFTFSEVVVFVTKNFR
jgi:hypothetical protein